MVLQALHLLNHSFLVQSIHKVVMPIYFSLLLLEFLPNTQNIEESLEGTLEERRVCLISDNIRIVFNDVDRFVEYVDRFSFPEFHNVGQDEADFYFYVWQITAKHIKDVVYEIAISHYCRNALLTACCDIRYQPAGLTTNSFLLFSEEKRLHKIENSQRYHIFGLRLCSTCHNSKNTQTGHNEGILS